MRILHTMLRVGNLDRSLASYTDVLGMRLLRKQDTQAVNSHLHLSVTKRKVKVRSSN